MSQRFSGRERKELENYPTPAWVIGVVAPHLQALGVTNVWEPAAGGGQMVTELRNHGFGAVGTDIINGNDFLNGCVPPPTFDAIVTNPPYGKGGRTAQQFIEQALEFTRPSKGSVAMLLKIDFDSGKTRRHVFADCPAFAGKVVLNDRIEWFKSVNGNKSSDNHAWYLWSWQHVGRPTISYARDPARGGSGTIFNTFSGPVKNLRFR
jgi:hypothetical protein